MYAPSSIGRQCLIRLTPPPRLPPCPSWLRCQTLPYRAVGTDEALEHMLVLLDDEQPQVRETLIHAVKRYGKRAAEPLFSHLHTPQTSLIAKETALLALARLDSVRAEQFLAFWEGELRDVYRYKLMRASLAASQPLSTDLF